MLTRNLQRLIASIPASDGAGVKLRRSLGQSQHARLDPFLMLDEFSSENADDYIAGFPNHAHRGFETVTYMLEGHMLHQDHLGNRGDLRGGDVQWMTAGRGIIHSEMPQQESGRMRGFQLWINLPASEKMKPAGYRDVPASRIPVVETAGARAKVIAGTLELLLLVQMPDEPFAPRIPPLPSGERGGGEGRTSSCIFTTLVRRARDAGTHSRADD